MDKKPEISVIGMGYVGVVQAVGLAELGYKVFGIDIDENKINSLNQGKLPIYEEGIEPLLKKHLGKNLIFCKNYDVVESSDIIFICVGTPQDERGKTDLTFLNKCVDTLKTYLSENYRIIVIKSTVPVGTCRKIYEGLKNCNIDVVSNPEFLREGTALHDFFNPDRIVLGYKEGNETSAKKCMRELYEYFAKKKVPIIETTWESAELIKYASNSFLATKISFVNELARFCEKAGADIKVVAKGMGLDPRIGGKFLNAGLGYGGSCFPKDVKSLIHQFYEHEIIPSILEAVDKVNETQIDWFLRKIEEELGGIKDKTIAVLGLAFKPGTDDLRESIAIALIEKLKNKGAKVKGFDYIEKARENAKAKGIDVFESVHECCKGAEAIIIATEDEKFREENWNSIFKKVKNPYIFDGRNILDKEKLEKIGIKYFGVGR